MNPELGKRSACSTCGAPIVWSGHYWTHTSLNTPRHPATPVPDAPTTADEYQVLASRTLIAAPDAEYTPAEIMLVWNAIGLAGEAGEVADTIKKAVFHRHGVNRDALTKELGDVLWYVAALCTKLDIAMSEVMERNIAKLRQRYPDGYSADASKARVDVG